MATDTTFVHHPESAIPIAAGSDGSENESRRCRCSRIWSTEQNHSDGWR